MALAGRARGNDKDWRLMMFERLNTPEEAFNWQLGSADDGA